MNLQQELCDARKHHINLHVEYSRLKSTYEKLVNLSEEKWQFIEDFGLCDTVNKTISKFWENIEYITTAFFDILELLDQKENLERSILTIWRSQVFQRSTDQLVPKDDVPFGDEGSALPGCVEYLKSQLTELNGRIKWVEYNVMKYRFATLHGVQLKTSIDKALKRRQKAKLWRFFSRSLARNTKLDEEVEWYQKNLKFFQEDVVRITSVHRAITRKCLTPEEQKRFPSRCTTIENALRGNPTNYKGSWIETSKHFAASQNILVQQGASSTELRPCPSSVAGPSRIDSIAAFSGIHFFSRQRNFKDSRTGPAEPVSGCGKSVEKAVNCRPDAGFDEPRRYFCDNFRSDEGRACEELNLKRLSAGGGNIKQFDIDEQRNENNSKACSLRGQGDKGPSNCSSPENSAWNCVSYESVEKTSTDTVICNSLSLNLSPSNDIKVVVNEPPNPFDVDDSGDVVTRNEGEGIVLNEHIDSSQERLAIPIEPEDITKCHGNAYSPSAQPSNDCSYFESLDEPPAEMKPVV